MEAHVSLKLLHEPTKPYLSGAAYPHKKGQHQCNGVRILTCYIPLVRRLLLHHVTGVRNGNAECYLVSKSAIYLQNPGCQSLAHGWGMRQRKRQKKGEAGI